MKDFWFMIFFIGCRNRLCFTTMAVLLATVAASGCGGLDPAEQPSLNLVNELGGEVRVEEGHIVSVNLDSTDVNDSHLTTLKTLPKLKSLSLNYNKGITDAVFNAANEMESLEELNVADTAITQGAADKFRNEHPDMVVSGPGI